MYPFQIKTYEEYQEVYQKSVKTPEKFWEEIAETFSWKRKWDKVLDWDFRKPEVKWFEGAQLNITENCIDRHLATRGNEAAIIWEPNDPNQAHRTISYKELSKEVCQFAQILKNLGVKKGDRVCIYMGMIPELAFATLACARIGAVHSVIFGGFSAKSIKDRVLDAQAEYIITCDGSLRGEKIIPLKNVVDEAIQDVAFIKNVLVVERTKQGVNMKTDRDVWYHHKREKVSDVTFVEAESMDAEDPLFILYTSGSTGKPKGVVHSSAGYMVYSTYSFVNVFQYTLGDVYFCTADIGWITGHSYIIYGPLSAGATTMMFEGIPTFPDPGRFWDIVDKYQVNILYTAPTAIRSLMACDISVVNRANLNSLKVLGTVGEPINDEAWQWYHHKIGKGNCPIVDTWWQTETGGIMISSLAGVTPEKSTFAALPLPGIQPCLVDESGNEISGNGVSGNLCVKFPWPSMIRTTWGDHERCRQVYFSAYTNKYFTGDGCLRDENGLYRITGRVDDVLNVSGHRIGTAELENAINEHPLVVESAVVGYPHDIKGQGIYAYVICEQHPADLAQANKEIIALVRDIIGPVAKPDKIQFVNGLPKTRSGKIMRRILRKVAEGELENLGDITTLLNPEVVKEIIEGSI